MTEPVLKNAEEQELYHRLSKQMRKGLKQIYKEISTATSDSPGVPDQTGQLFHEASAQLAEVVAATQTATESIMDIVERHMDYQAESQGLIAAVRTGTATPEQLDRLEHMNTALGADLTNIMTALSFQDLTGQRIKKVVYALDKIESTVIELYVSSGLILEGRELDPQKDIAALEQEAQKAVENLKQGKSELKGPSTDGVSQDNIDAMLAQLGMD